MNLFLIYPDIIMHVVNTRLRYALAVFVFVILPYSLYAQSTDMRQRELRLGVMLPLHDDNGDGRRMVEYYRGILMACDSMRHIGISVDVKAVNCAEDADVTTLFNKHKMADRDVIIGPLYSKQVRPLSVFAENNDIKLFIPFSIETSDLFSNRNIFQVYQNANDFNEATIQCFLKRFKGYNAVVIDCNDTTSRKGIFTFGLRRRLDSMGQAYKITNINSPEAVFAKAFSSTLPNVVILNTGRSPQLNVVFAKLNGLVTVNPNIRISMFGYTEWMMYTKYALDNFYKFDVHIPASFFYNPLSSRTQRFETKYRWNFHQDMIQALPRFAITGFDHVCWLLQGLHMYGKNFQGAAGTTGYTPTQTPLSFERVGNGGLQNRSILFVHYTPEHRVETINY